MKTGCFFAAWTIMGVSATHWGSCKHTGKCGGVAMSKATTIYSAVPQQVVIPKYVLPAVVAPTFSAPPLQSYAVNAAPTFPFAKPLFHKHGLIQVEVPHATKTIISSPASIATRPEFHVSSARMGKVVDQTGLQYFCKRPGFVLEGTQCTQTLVEAARYVCPGGYDALEDGGCHRRAAFLEHCPVGYTRRDGNCAKIVTTSFLQRCPEGSIPTADGGCERQVAHPLTPTCAAGGVYDARTGTCGVTAFVDARAYCPEGFTFLDGACVQEEVYDCTSHIAPLAIAAAPSTTVLASTVVQPIGHVHGAHHHNDLKTIAYPSSAVARQLHGYKDCSTPCITTCAVQPCAPCITQRAIACEEPVVATAVVPKIVTQPTKTTVTVQKTCTRVTSTALIFACDEGVLAKGNQCQIIQQVPPVPVCSVEGDLNFCYARQRLPALQECPLDYTKECLPGRPCECVALEAAAFIQSCPTGFETVGDGCVRVAQSKAVCPPGFALQGDQCVQVLKEAADCVFSVTYECDKATGSVACAPPATGSIGTFA